MNKTGLNYARQTVHQPSKVLRWFALASLLFPTVIVAPLYVEWLLASWSLGHLPRPGFDDPKYIAGSNWMHDVTGLAIISALPAAVFALAANAVEICINKPPIAQAVARLAILFLSWSVVFALFRSDPGKVLEWWFD